MCQVGDCKQSCTQEKWLEIPYLPGYQASCWGRIRNSRTGYIKAEQRNWRGYWRIQITKRNNGFRQNKHYRTHRLVAAAWLGDNIENDVNHIDCNKNNNAAYNLEWLSHDANIEAYWGIQNEN